MSLHYLLDGCNITHQMPDNRQAGSEDQRYSLLHFIESHRPQGQGANSVTVVFDGFGGWFQRKAFSFPVVFSLERSADDVIREMVERSRSKKSIRVVTDDRTLQYAVRALGASTVNVESFLSPRQPSRKKSPGTTAGTGKNSIPVSDQQRINEELKQIWLKKKKSD